jgi:hypothetical protein
VAVGGAPGWLPLARLLRRGGRLGCALGGGVARVQRQGGWGHAGLGLQPAKPRARRGGGVCASAAADSTAATALRTAGGAGAPYSRAPRRGLGENGERQRGQGTRTAGQRPYRVGQGGV